MDSPHYHTALQKHGIPWPHHSPSGTPYGPQTNNKGLTDKNNTSHIGAEE